jgi:hypothetical protein
VRCHAGDLERAAGIEPASLAWKAKVLPLHNARVGTLIQPCIDECKAVDRASAGIIHSSEIFHDYGAGTVKRAGMLAKDQGHALPLNTQARP